MMTGGGLSSLEVTVSLVLVEAEPAAFTAEQIITVPEFCICAFFRSKVD